jgi:hypothetical protein
VGPIRLLDDNHRIDGKIDERFSEKSTGFLRYGYSQASVDQGSLLGPLGAPLNAEFRAMNAVGSVTHIFTKNFLAELRLGYDRYRNRIAPWDLALPGNFTTAFPNGVPSINIFGFSSIGVPANVPRKEIDNVYDGTAAFMWHTGMHSLKFGVYGRELQSNGFANPYFSGLGSFLFGPGATLGTAASASNLTAAQLQANAFAAFLTGSPSQAGISGFFGTPTYRERQFGAYLTDTINLFHRVYLELGVRWDVFFGPESGVRGGTVVFNPATNTAIPQGFNNISARIARTNLDNVAPRIGLAFRPFDRFVFRAGYGLHFFALPFSLEPFNPAMFGTQLGIAGGLGSVPFTVPTVPTLAGATAPNLPFFVTTGRDLPTPYVQTFSGGFQGDLGNGFLMDIGYVGNLGRELPYLIPVTGAPGTGLAGLAAAGFPAGRTAEITTYGTGLTSNYNSLQVNLTKKFGAGLAFSGAYTFGKALDYGTALIDPFNRRFNYGPADWDRTHILSISHVWKLPFGPGTTRGHSGWASRVFADWELNGILRWATGTPYTVTFDPTACNCLGLPGVPATFNSPFVTNSLNGSASFNPNQFAAPAAGTFGALSRNAIRGPDFFVYNAALFRNFTIRENTKLELRAEAYNVTNTTNPVNPVANASLAGFGSTLGSVDGLAGRQFQVAIRILF